MNEEKAREIIESRGVIEVLYKGSPVWIENIKGENAEVTYLKSQKKDEIPLKDLEEGTGIENCCS